MTRRKVVLTIHDDNDFGSVQRLEEVADEKSFGWIGR